MCGRAPKVRAGRRVLHVFGKAEKKAQGRIHCRAGEFGLGPRSVRVLKPSSFRRAHRILDERARHRPHIGERSMGSVALRQRCWRLLWKPIRRVRKRHASLIMRKPGVGRLSLGVQALNDADLRFLGRLHDVRRPSGIGWNNGIYPLSSI